MLLKTDLAPAVDAEGAVRILLAAAQPVRSNDDTTLMLLARNGLSGACAPQAGRDDLGDRQAPKRDRKTIKGYLDGDRVPGEHHSSGSDPFERSSVPARNG